MKQCPACRRTYDDETLNFCLEDGATLLASYDPQATWVAPSTADDISFPTEILPSEQDVKRLSQPSRKSTQSKSLDTEKADKRQSRRQPSPEKTVGAILQSEGPELEVSNRAWWIVKLVVL